MVSQREAYREGYDRGYGLASIHNFPRHPNRATVEAFRQRVFASEENDRQMSPFEFTAHDFNESRDPDALWDAYDDGIAAGINAYVRQMVKGLAAKHRAAKKGVGQYFRGTQKKKHPLYRGGKRQRRRC